MQISLNEVGQVEGLTDEEYMKLRDLITVWNDKLNRNKLKTRYYEAKEGLKNLGIAIPEQFTDIDTVIGWPAKAVDGLQARSIFDGFVYQGDTNETLERIVKDNNLFLAYEQAVQNELINACVFASVSRGEGDEPSTIVNFHSAEAASALWNYRKKRIDWGIVVADVEMDERAGKADLKEVHLHCDYAVFVVTKHGNTWKAERRENPLGRPLMEVMAYRPSLKRPFGKSRISRTVMSITDCAVRSRLRAELGSEFYTTPQKYLLGADDEDFDKPRWESYIGYIFTATRDEDGNTPQYGQLPQASMLPHTEYMRDLAAQFSGETSIPMNSLGVVHDNPASAEAIYAAKEDLVIEAQALNRVNGVALETIAKIALCVENGTRFNQLDEEAQGIHAHFKNPAMPSVVSQADAMVKLVSVAPWIAETEYFLEEVGIDDASRARLLSDKAKLEAKAMIRNQMAQQQENKKQATMYEVASILKSYGSGKISKQNAINLFALIGIDADTASQMLADANDMGDAASGGQPAQGGE